MTTHYRRAVVAVVMMKMIRNSTRCSLTLAHNHIDNLESKREKLIERIEELESKYAKLKKAHNALKKQLTAAGTMPTGAGANTESDSGEESL